MLYFIKYFAIIFCCIFYYIKLLNLPIGKKLFPSFFAFNISLSVIAVLFETFFPYATVLALILFSFLYFNHINPTSPELGITTTIISYGISYVIFAISVTLVSISITALFHFDHSSYNHTLYQTLTAIAQLLITPLPFCSKRLKKGMPFLYNKINTISLMIMSILILFTALLISNNGYNENWYLYPFLLVFLLAIFIYLSWKNNITKTYLDKLKEKDIAELNAELVKNQDKIKELEDENRKLSKIVHSDNKLVPAMTLAVESFIRDASELSAESAATGHKLLADLEQMSSARKGILRKQEQRCRAIPSTGSSAVDNLLKYMQQKAYEAEIDLEITVSCNIEALIGKHISEQDLCTLLADLLENALIATRCRKGHHILLTMDMIEKFYTIHIFDSGIPFTKEVLLDLGVTRHTTHGDEGGSGIGLVTTYEFLQKCGASFMIEEYEPDSGLFTKKISVTFNNLRQYTLVTCRDADETAFLKQRADLLVIRKTSHPSSAQ